MELFELQEKIKTKQIPNLLIFTGNEYEIIKLYINQILKITGRTLYNLSSVCSILQRNKVISITNVKNLYISRYEKEILTNDKLWDKLENLGDTMIIIQQATIDKRGKFYKRFENSIVDFCEQDIKTVSLMLKNVCKLSDKNRNELIAGCRNNYSRCLLEIDKLNTYSSIYKISVDEAYNRLKEQKVLCFDNDIQIQQFIKLLMTKDKACYAYLQKLKDKTATMVIIAWLYNAFRNQLITETVTKPSVENTGLNYFFLKECLDRRGYFTTTQLKNAFCKISEVEQGIKLGLIEEAIALDYLLVNIL